MGLDLAKFKERFDKRKGRGDRFELQDGDNVIRILPPSLQYFAGEVDYIAFEYIMHYKLGVEGNKTAEACPKTLDRKLRCPICEAVSKLYKLDTPEDKARARDIKAKKRYVFNVIDLSNKDKGIQILETGPTIYDDLGVFIKNPKWGDILDLDKGRDVVITKTNSKETQSGYTEYSVTPDPTTTSAREYLPANFKEAIGQLQKAVPLPKSYQELKVIIEGGDSQVDISVLRATLSPVSQDEDDGVQGTPDESEPEVQPQNKVVETNNTPHKLPEEGDVPPSCFGVQYGPRRQECGPCPSRNPCREKLLE